MLSTKNYEINY